MAVAQPAHRPFGPSEDVQGRDRFELQRLANPTTGKIPPDMREKELKYAATLPSREDSRNFKGPSALSIPPVNWEPRGPENIGGRTLALGIDVSNENIINAGSTSGGMWHSTDGGTSWARTTPLDQIDNISALAQDTHAGRTNVWYCATGEPYVASIGEPIGYGEYVGNGLFKSTDDGITWNVLLSTMGSDSVTVSQPFNWVNRIVVDPRSDTQSVVYAAVMGGIERSTDGGKTWKMTLGQFPNGGMASDIAITSNGVLYAVITEIERDYSTSAPTFGVYRSTDGIHWTNITPSSWLSQTIRAYIATAPSDSNIMYVVCNSYSNSQSAYQFWKYTFKSGDGTGTGGTWNDRTASLLAANVEFGGLIHVQPNNPNVVYIGAVQLWRSTDGFATSSNVSSLNYYYGTYDLHVDHEAMAFYPSDPEEMIVGCDGGLYYTADNLADQVSWTSLDNNYVTAQFFSIAVDHYTPGSVAVIGGTQDNGSSMTISTDETQPWTFVFGGDGQAAAIAGDRSLFYASLQSGYTEVESFDGYSYGRIDPTGGTGYAWQNPFVLDPNNSDRMYFGGGHILWRNNDLSSIPLYDTGTTNVNWDSLPSTRLPANSPFGQYSTISVIGVSTVPANRVYYGTNDGMLFRLDNAVTGTSKPIAIWNGKGFPQYAFVSSIAVDPNNADSVIVAFANFGVQSLFLTTNGGTTWRPIGGNLEQNPDGSGNGPSVRAAVILPTTTGNMYLVGTTTGVYSTTNLNGMQTVWSLEGASVIGNDIINALDARPSDGYVAVGSCGSGAFTARFAASGVLNTEPSPTQLMLEPNYPNPYSSVTHFEFKIPEDGTVSLGICDMRGGNITTLVSKDLEPGTYTSEWNSSGIANGVYLCKLTENGQTVSRLISIEH